MGLGDTPAAHFCLCYSLELFVALRYLGEELDLNGLAKRSCREEGLYVGIFLLTVAAG